MCSVEVLPEFDAAFHGRLTRGGLYEAHATMVRGETVL
jgi:hypothetical protein